MNEEKRDGAEGKAPGQARRRQGRGRHFRPNRQEGAQNDAARQPASSRDQAKAERPGRGAGRGADRKGERGIERQEQSIRHDQAPRQENPNRQPDRGGKQQRAQGGQAQKRPESPRPQIQVPPRATTPSFSCALCEKPILDLTGAITDKESGQPVHFDCALERVTAAESLEPGEKIAYLGSGCFGVVTQIEGRPEGAFTVKRRIQWEKEGEKKDWRKLLSSHITKI